MTQCASRPGNGKMPNHMKSMEAFAKDARPLFVETFCLFIAYKLTVYHYKYNRSSPGFLSIYISSPCIDE